MKLLIIGAGGHGHVVKEVAEATCQYEQIEFIDDNSDIAIGRTADLEKIHSEYDSAFVSIGNNSLRESLIQKLIDLGYSVPILVHPTAYVSKSARIGNGTIIEPKAIVNANALIGIGCIISVGTIIDHNVVIQDYCHINSGAIVCNASQVNYCTKIDAGCIVLK